MYYYPGHRIQNQFCTQSALSPLPGEHSGQSPFYRRAQCQLNHNIVRILPGPHLTTWVESSNVDKVSCWRTKVYRATVGFEPGLSTRESSGHTTIPRHLRAGRETTLHADAATCILRTPHSLLAPESWREYPARTSLVVSLLHTGESLTSHWCDFKSL